MAIDAQSQGQVQEILAVMRRRVLQVILPAVLGVAIAGAVSVLLPRMYTVTTQLELREVILPIGGFGASSLAIRRDISSAHIHVKSLERIQRVIEKLEWQDFQALTAAEKHEYLRRVAAKIGVIVRGGAKVVGSSFIFLAYSDTDGQRAEHFLNRLRDSYTAEVVERFRNTARDARDTLNNQLSIAYQNYIDRQQSSAELKKRYGLSPTQRGANGRNVINEDPVFIRLNRAKAEMMDNIGRLTRSRKAKELAEDRYNKAPREVPEQSVTGGLALDELYQAIEANIARAEAAQEGLRHEHSQWKVHEATITAEEARREELFDRANSLAGEDVRMVLNPDRLDSSRRIKDLEEEITILEAEHDLLVSAIDSLSQENAELTDVYRQVAQLDGEVDIARARYVTAKRLFGRQRQFVEFIAQPHANPFTVPEVARALAEPSSPKEGLVIFAGLILGLAFGVLTAIIAEYGRNAFRSATDLSRVLSVPVLGAVNRIITGREARAIFARRAMVVSSTLILAGIIFWVTWAYEEQPRLLGHQLTHFIDGLRMELR